MGSKLGQHFLTDKGALRRIADSLEIKSSDTIIEIGPGHGELTEYLIEASPKKIIVIEMDYELLTSLKKKHGDSIEVVGGDALKELPKVVGKLDESYKLIGNIPYYITGKLLRTVGDLKTQPKLTILTIQKEVAERLCAKIPEMNLLAASVQFWGSPEIIFSIKKFAFSPPPKVDSAAIKIIPKDKPKNKEAYYKIIKMVFRQPRKTILNNIAAGSKIGKAEIIKELSKLGLREELRPQNLSLRDLISLSNVF